MATKYTRNEGVREAREQRATPFMSQPRPRRPFSVTNRALLTYMGCFMFFALIYASSNFAGGAVFDGQPVIDGDAVVVGKDAAATPPRLQLEVLLVSGKTTTIWTDSEPEPFANLQEGDRVAVRFQQSRNLRELRVVEVGWFALPPAPE